MAADYSAILFQHYTGDGSTTDFAYTADHILPEDVKASVAGVEVVLTPVDATTFRITPAPTTGAEVILYRDSDVTQPKYTFPNPTNIKSENLDGNSTQNIYLHQETRGYIFDLLSRAGYFSAGFIGVTPAGNITTADVQAALEELDTKKLNSAGDIANDFSVNNLTVGGTVDGRDIANDGTKLDGIEPDATADQSAGEIKIAYESNADTNVFTDAEETKLAGIEAGADVTDTTNVDSAGAVMHSDVSETQGKLIKSGSETYRAVKVAFGQTTPPTATDDSSQGYSVGSDWYDETNDAVFTCIDSTVGAAQWLGIGSASGGVSAVTATLPLESSGGTTPTISLSYENVDSSLFPSHATTAVGGTAAADGANTWAKLATFTPPADDYWTQTFLFTIAPSDYQFSPAVSTIPFELQLTNLVTTGIAAHNMFISGHKFDLAGIEGLYVAFPSGSTAGSPIELWVKKSNDYTKYALKELSRSDSAVPATVVYETNSAWQATTPTGVAIAANYRDLLAANLLDTNSVGSYVFARASAITSGVAAAADMNRSGATNAVGSGAIDGSWKCLGQATVDIATLWVRIE